MRGGGERGLEWQPGRKHEGRKEGVHERSAGVGGVGLGVGALPSELNRGRDCWDLGRGRRGQMGRRHERVVGASRPAGASALENEVCRWLRRSSAASDASLVMIETGDMR